MKTLSLALGLMVSASSFAGIIYSNSADLSTSATQIKLTDAEYKLVPTKVEVRQIPGCNPNGERHPVECQETVVLESQLVITANVQYVDTMFPSEGNEKSNLALNFRLEDFSAEDIAALKAAYPTWRHPFSRAGQYFAKKNLELQVRLAERTIQVVDVQNSTICRELESGEIMHGCVENIVYKPAKTTVKEVTVLKK